jgi:DNA helicase-2/ATP-dependent DNA helicase PcrA
MDTCITWLEANKNTLVDREKEFEFAFAGKTLHGFIDRIEKTPTGGYVVIDFKSGSKPGDITKKSLPENIQLNLYAMAIRELYGTLPERATLFYLKDNKVVDYQPTEETIGAFIQNIEQMIREIETGEFPARPDYQRCDWCPYGDLCESREDEGGGE